MNPHKDPTRHISDYMQFFDGEWFPDDICKDAMFEVDHVLSCGNRDIENIYVSNNVMAVLAIRGASLTWLAEKGFTVYANLGMWGYQKPCQGDCVEFFETIDNAILDALHELSKMIKEDTDE